MNNENTVKPVIRGIYRGEIWMARISNNDTHNGIRPVLIISSWRNNIKSNLVNVTILTKQIKLKEKNSVVFNFEEGKISTILCSQITTLLKENLLYKMADAPKIIIDEVDEMLRKQLQLQQFDIKYTMKMVKEIIHLRKYIDKNNLYDDKDLKINLHNQMIELKAYCEKYNENINDYLKLGEIKYE